MDPSPPNHPPFKERVKSLARSFCNRGVYLALKALVLEAIILYRDLKGRWTLRRQGWLRPEKINLGCGPLLKTGYLNVDIYPGGDVTLDLRKDLPFASASCGRIFSEHFVEHLEHLEYPHIGYPSEARHLLTECYRVLRRGGLLSLSVPDAEWPILDYPAGIGAPFYQTGMASNWFPPGVTRMEAINRWFRQAGQHPYMYDFETLQQLLRQIGFVDIQRRAYDPSEDSAIRRIGSLFVLARKPLPPS
jgi:predicted SAM-dependent methyltransferase